MQRIFKAQIHKEQLRTYGPPQPTENSKRNVSSGTLWQFRISPVSVSLTFILPIKLTKLEIYLEMKSNHLTSEPRDRLTDDMSKITKKVQIGFGCWPGWLPTFWLDKWKDVIFAKASPRTILMTERVQLQVRKKYIPLLVITMKPIGFATDTIT